MVAAKLDQSGVIVTKFRQNRLTLKGRIAGQRHTDTPTDTYANSAENKDPSGLQSGQTDYQTVYNVSSDAVQLMHKNSKIIR